MHYWDSIDESAIAPYPIVPTYRRNPLSKFPNSNYHTMPAPASLPAITTRPRGESGPRPEARSAGMAERATRSENLSDLVRFLQAGSNVPNEHDTDTDNTTALPASEKDLKKEQMEKEIKPLHRRLLQFTQRQKRESSSKSKLDDNQRQIEALQREGYLFPSIISKPTATSTRSKESLDGQDYGLQWSKASVDQELSKSKMHDVETIGQPWLETEDKDTQQPADTKRLAPLELDDFSSMINGAVILSEFDDTVLPSNQTAAPSRPSKQPSSRHSRSHSSQYVPGPLRPRASSEALKQNNKVLKPPIVSETKATDPRDGLALRSTCSTNNLITSHTENQYNSISTGSTNMKTVHSMEFPKRPIEKNISKGYIQAPDRAPPAPLVTGTSPPVSLTLFPNVAPLRGTSRNTLRIPIGSQPKVSNAKSYVAPTGSSTMARKKEVDSPNMTQSNGELGLGKSVAPISLTEPAATTKGQRISRSTSIAMGTLSAFPLPAPTRPLPSIPISRKPSLSSTSQNSAAIQKARMKSKSSNLQSLQPSPISEDPQEINSGVSSAAVPQTSTDEDPKLATSKSQSPSTSPEQRTPKRHIAQVSSANVQGPVESPNERREEQDLIPSPLTESPILGQTTPTRIVRRSASQALQLNTPIGQKHLPFGLPSPPPSAALPLDPPTQSSAERAGHCSFTTPIVSGTTSSGSTETAFGLTHHRRIPSCSNMSRDNVRHGIIPGSYKRSLSQSPIPSSDDEGCGPSTRSVHSNRSVEKHGRNYQVRCGSENAQAHPSNGRLRISSANRPLTPQSRGNTSFDRAVSPQSQYSQSTYRSQESQGSRDSNRSQSEASQASSQLEDRVAKLERQNQMLQAALLAALNAGAKSNIELHESAVSPIFPTAGPGNSSSRFASRPDSWMSSSRSSENSGFDTSCSTRDSRARSRQLD